MAFLSAKAFDNVNNLQALLGAFWGGVFKDQEKLRNLLAAVGHSYYEVYLQMCEMHDSLGKDSVPIHSNRNWLGITFSQTAQLSSDALKIKYGDTGLVYGGGEVYGSFNETYKYAYPLPTGTETFSHLYNLIQDPTMMLARDIDYKVDTVNNIILFRYNMLTDSRVAVNVVLDETGVETDKTFTLWARNYEWDQQHIWNHFGFVLNIWMKSSTFYRDFISALWDCLVQGPSRSAVAFVLAALTGVPCVKDEEEVVETVLKETDSVMIITDKNVYEFASGSTPVVASGDSVRQGEALVDSVRVYEPTATTDWSAFKGLAFGPRFLGMPLEGPITFENKVTPVTYIGKDINGRVLVTFEVEGWDKDVISFWEHVHKNGLAGGKTLANYLDVRVNKIGEPIPTDIPSTINPFTLVMDNIFRNNLYLIFMRPADFAPGAPGISSMGHVLDYLPQQTTFIIYIETTPITEQYSLAGTVDDLGFMPAIEPTTDTVYAGVMVNDLGPTFRYVKEKCR